MSNFVAFPKRRQTRFLHQLTDFLDIHKRNSELLFSSRTPLLPKVDEQARVFVLDDSLIIAVNWHQLLDGPDSTEVSGNVRLTLFMDNIREHDDEQPVRGSLLNVREIDEVELMCSCNGPNHFSYMSCPHAIAAISYLQSKLSRVSSEIAWQWLVERIVSPHEIGSNLVTRLEALNQTPENEKESTGHRVVWRIDIDSDDDELFKVEMVVQRPKGRSGWTVGKRVREPLRDLPVDAIENDQDRIMALIYTSLNTRLNSLSPAESLAVLEQLSRCPNLVWDEAGFPTATIKRLEPKVELNDSNDGYAVESTIDGRPLELFDVVISRSGERIGATRIDNTLEYFFVPQERAEILTYLEEAKRLGAVLTKDEADKCARVLSDTPARRRLKLSVAESLAGPDVVLPPVIELQLIPRENFQMEARLRVHCDALDEPPTPGIGTERSLIPTAAGAYHIVRDLQSEVAAADIVATDLMLGDFNFDGPYTWLLGGIEESLKLIERVRELGERAPIVCWPKSKPMRMIGDITPQSLRVRLSSERDWFGIEGELNLDGLQVPLAELLVALRSGNRYVQLAENQFAAISDDLRARMTMIDDLSSKEGTGLRMARAAAPLIDQAIGIDIPAERDDKWRQAIEQLNSLEAAPAQPSEELRATLRDYQLSGYQWLSKLSQWGLGGCLADDMGLGKTVQTLAVLIDRASKGPTLIVAPTSVGINWFRETLRFTPSLKPCLYREHDRDQLIQSAGPGDLIIISYQLLQRDIDRISSRTWATLVLDEAQFIKNFQTKTNQAVRRLDVDWCVALSGTPLENHLGELWSLMRILSPGLLGSWERFRNRFGEPIERDRDPKRLQALGRVVRPFILRRTKQEVLTELPPRTEVVLTAELSPAERKRYDAARVAAISELSTTSGSENEQQQRIRVLSWLTRLRQLSCHPGLVDPRWNKSSAKLDLFLETVDELLANDHRALVFSQFVQHLSLVRKALDEKGIRYQYLDGSTSPAKRQEAVDAFQTGDGDLFLISLKAGGTGLNLTAADYVLHLDPWWNPAVEDQATDRAHRIGQQRPVTVYRLVAKDTIEEQILSMHEGKRELLSGVLDGADRASKMSTQELVELIRENQLITPE